MSETNKSVIKINESSDQNMLIFILFLPAVAPVTASKPPKGGSVSPVPPPTQFANEILVQQQSKNQVSSSSTSSSNVKFSSSSSSKTTKAGGVKVLPSPVSRPVQLQEPAADGASVAEDHVDHKLSVDSRNSNEVIVGNRDGIVKAWASVIFCNMRCSMCLVQSRR